ncbi:MAG: sigma-70 family RNA polymerase sigma factor [Planctomycetota bacterium]
MTPDPATADFLRFRETGDLGALERALATVQPALSRQVQRQLRNEAEAADVVQETMLAALQRSDQFQGDATLQAWLGGISRHLMHRVWRRPSPALGLAEAADRGDGPATTAEQEQLDAVLRDAVAQLQDPYREVMQLYLAGETSAQIIAARLGRSPSTVRTQLERALRRLRDLVPRSLAPMVVAMLAARGTAAEPRPATGRGRRRAALAAAAAILALLAGTVVWWRAAPDGQPAAPPRPDPEPSPLVASTTPDPPLRTTAAEPSAAPNASVPATASVEVALRWASSGAPAAGVAVILAAPAHPGGKPLIVHFDSWRHAITDADGIAQFDAVPAGPAQVRFEDLRVEERLDIGAGAEVRVARDVRPAFDITGRILDPEGNGVAGAELWASSSGRLMTPGYVAAISDQEGNYRAPLVSRSSQIDLWAEADGYRPSSRFQLKGSASAGKLDFSLLRDPRVIRGVLRDPEGAAVPGVIGFYPAAVPDRAPPALYVQADAAGRFTCASLDPIGYHMAATAAGWAGSITKIDLTPGDADVELSLLHGAMIEGKIHGIGAVDTEQLRVGPRRPGPRRANPEQFLLLPAATVSPDATYRLGPMPPGPVIIAAFDPYVTNGLLARRGLSISTTGTLPCDLYAGGEPSWRVSVLTARGRPAAGVVVALAHPTDEPQSGRFTARAATDAAGTVVFHAPPEQPMDVLVYAERSVALPLAFRPGVRPGADLSVQLPTAQVPLGSRVVGRWPTPATDGPPPPTILLRQADSGFALQQTLTTDAADLAFDAVPAGSYLVEARHAEPPHASAVLTSCEVDGTDAVDLGELTPPKWAQLRLLVTEAAPPSPLTVHVLDAQGHLVVELPIQPGTPRKLGVPAGHLTIGYFDTSLRWQRRTLTATPGATESMTLDPGTGRACRLRFPFGEAGRESVNTGMVTIRAATATRECALDAVYSSSSHFAVRLHLAPGAYDVTFWARWNLPQTRRIRIVPGGGIQDLNLPLQRR